MVGLRSRRRRRDPRHRSVVRRWHPPAYRTPTTHPPTLARRLRHALDDREHGQGATLAAGADGDGLASMAGTSARWRATLSAVAGVRPTCRRCRRTRLPSPYARTAPGTSTQPSRSNAFTVQQPELRREASAQSAGQVRRATRIKAPGSHRSGAGHRAVAATGPPGETIKPEQTRGRQQERDGDDQGDHREVGDCRGPDRSVEFPQAGPDPTRQVPSHPEGSRRCRPSLRVPGLRQRASHRRVTQELTRYAS